MDDREGADGVVARTPLLLRRRFAEDDAGAVFALYADAEVMRFMGAPPASVHEEAANLRAHIARYYQGLGFGLWAVILRETGELAGRCGLLRSEIGGRSETEISYLLARRFWGQGLAAEAARAVLHHGFGALGMERIVAVIDPRNTASRRVAQRIGMRYERDVPYKQFGTVHLFASHAAD